jgi:hypothetical protein
MNVMLEKALSQRYMLPNTEVILSPKSQSVGNRSNDRSLKSCCCNGFKGASAAKAIRACSLFKL